MSARVAAGALAGALAMAACSERQQIVLAIDTTAGIPCDIDRIRIRATGSSARTIERELAGTRLPLSITLEDDTASGGFDLEVSGLKGQAEVLRVSGPMQFGTGADPLAVNVVLESSCTPSQPCALPALIAYERPPPPVTARFECGANVRRYAPGPTAESFRDVCTVPAGANAGKVLIGGARGAALLPLPASALEGFNFRFYSRPIRQIWAHEDGYISFSPSNPDARNDLDPGPFDRDLRGVGVPPPPQSLMPFWDGLTLGPSGVCYSLEGAPGTQKLRVTWSSTCQTVVCTADRLSFTVVLDERSQRIAFTYGEMVAANAERAQGATATIGIVSTNPVGCTVAECSRDTGLCTNGKPCGYTQLFSNMPQTPRVQNVQLEPIADP